MTEERLCKLARLLDDRRHFEAVFLAGLYRRERASDDGDPARKANGILAIPDGASKPRDFNKPYFIEVKTGIDPPFTVNQRPVYPLICMGGHATSFDPRVSDLGLTEGAPFPP